MHRFASLAPELAITAAPDPFPWISLQTNGVRHGTAVEECRMGRDFGRGDSSNPAGRLGKDQSDEPEGQVAGREPEFFDLEITC